MPQSHDKSLGPLTTRFTPPPSCFVEKIETGVGPISGMFSVSYGVSCGPDGDSFDTNCFPPITLTDKAGYPRDQHDDRQFSPGFYCPMGWNTGCSWERTSELLKSGLQEWDMSKLTNMKVGETHVACCPRWVHTLLSQRTYYHQYHVIFGTNFQVRFSLCPTRSDILLLGNIHVTSFLGPHAEDTCHQATWCRAQ